MDAQSLARLSTAYAEARILHSAVDLGIFETLANNPATEAEIREKTGLHARFARDFLGALVTLGLLERTGRTYRNSAVADEFLTPSGPVFLGGRIRTASTRHYHTWGHLTDALRDGEPKAGGGQAFEELGRDPAKARNFLVHMDANNGQVAPQLVEHVDWSTYRSFVDVGGARGNVAAQLVKALPHLTGGVFELPYVEPFFDEFVASLGLTDRLTFHAGSFFDAPLPATDVVVFGHVLHDWTAEKRQELLEKAFSAISPAGAVVIYDQMLDDEAPDLRSLIGSLNVGLITGGSEYTVGECREQVEKAGFRYGYDVKLPRGNDTVVVGVKEA
ncbi:MAG: methyltransferase [Actinocatenispora sp.]